MTLCDLAKIAAVHTVFYGTSDDAKALELWNAVQAMTTDEQFLELTDEDDSDVSVGDDLYGNLEETQRSLTGEHDWTLRCMVQAARPFIDALQALRGWNYNNVAYWPQIAADEQNNQQEDQDPEELSGNIDLSVHRLLCQFEEAEAVLTATQTP